MLCLFGCVKERACVQYNMHVAVRGELLECSLLPGVGPNRVLRLYNEAFVC